ncbi:MAG TPA: hypothetical protein VMH20_12265 [Verrucomicrobiae bacterium]|nr:hypothetical protein [Verrucomicrobiae bacterium]
MKREIIRVEPFDSNFEKWGVPVSTCTRAGDMIFVSGLPGWRFESSPGSPSLFPTTNQVAAETELLTPDTT